MRTRSGWMALSLGVVLGGMAAGTYVYAQSARGPGASAGPYRIVDTAGSTYLLNSQSGDVWRLGFTEVKGDRYWFGTHVPMQPQGTFEAFQAQLRRRLGPGR